MKGPEIYFPITVVRADAATRKKRVDETEKALRNLSEIEKNTATLENISVSLPLLENQKPDHMVIVLPPTEEGTEPVAH